MFKILQNQITGGPDSIYLINHIAKPWGGPTFQDSLFLGFYPILGKHNWGADINGTPCAAVHLFRPIPGFYWGDDVRDTAEYAERNPWVLMFHGSDNKSCFIRFENRDHALKWIEDHEGVDADAGELLFYNS